MHFHPPSTFLDSYSLLTIQLLIKGDVSRIQTLTSKITQVCQDIHDIKLRWILITQSEEQSDDITNNILTNQSGCKDTWGSDRSRPETPGIHEGCAEDDNDYTYRTPNCHEHGNQDSLQCHDIYQPLRLPKPSGMTPEPLPYPDPSEASEIPSWLPTSLLSLLKKDNTESDALLMYMERCQGHSTLSSQHVLRAPG